MNLKISDLYELKNLQKLDTEFAKTLRGDEDLTLKARALEDFLVELFAVKKENAALQQKHESLREIYLARREFVQRDVAKKFSTPPSSFAPPTTAEDLDTLELHLAKQMLAGENLDFLTNY
ncbi:MAG: hypothetical protein FJX34_05115, partial [Alphaproteobacteria bacterium]|nr:hypothetical protein [Alphaproteobacteria bacterium]